MAAQIRMIRQQPQGSLRKPLHEIETALRVGFAALNFAIAWAFIISSWPMIGIIFGWAPALFAGVFGFFVMDLLLGIIG